MYFVHIYKKYYFTFFKRLKAPLFSLCIKYAHMQKTLVAKPYKRGRKNELIKDHAKLVESYPKVPITVDCVIFGFEEDNLKVLLIRSDLETFKGKWSLLGDIVCDTEELDGAANRVLQQRTGMEDIFLELTR